MESETEQLRTELAELRESTRLLIALLTTATATTPNAAEAAKTIAAMLKDAEATKPRSDTFWEAATGVLKMLTGAAVRQFPGDADLLELHHGVRPNRH